MTATVATKAPKGLSEAGVVGPNAPSRGARRDTYPVPATPPLGSKVGG